MTTKNLFEQAMMEMLETLSAEVRRLEQKMTTDEISMTTDEISMKNIWKELEAMSEREKSMRK